MTSLLMAPLRHGEIGLKVKADWQPYLHQLRTREIELIFARCPRDAFACGLELGAGDGFQSTLLSRYVRRLIATDYRPIDCRPRGQRSELASAGDNREGALVSFMTCDAERVDEVFAAAQFDLIFSSNMMEHLPDPGRALAGMLSVLDDDGIAIHVVPSPFWKLSHLAGFYPNAMLGRLDRWLRRSRVSTRQEGETAGLEWENNPKIASRGRPYLARLLWPAAHGASGSNLKEFELFSRRYWTAQFAAAGFRVAAAHRGPVSSGYGFGWDSARSLCERVGLSSETVYVTVKASCPNGQPDRLRYFLV